MADAWTSAASSPTTRQTALRDELERRLTRTWAKGTIVLAIGFAPSSTDRLVAVLEAAGSELVGDAQGLDTILTSPELAGVFSHVIVNLDVYADVLQAVDTLLALRKAAPQVVVLCVSTSVHADDFFLERRAICHATLRAPFGLDRLREAVIAATENAASCRRPDGVH